MHSETTFEDMYGKKAKAKARGGGGGRRGGKKRGGGADEDDDDDADDDAYESAVLDDGSFEAQNPLALLDAMETADPEDEEDDDENAEAEEIPSGISIPKTQNRGAHNKPSGKKGASSSSKRSSSKRSSASRSKRSSSSRRSADRAPPASLSDDYADHELLAPQQSGARAAHDDAADDALNDDDADALLARRRRGWLSSASVAGLGGGAMSGSVMLLLGLPALAVNMIPGVPYALAGQFLFVPLLLYVYVSLPVFFGTVFAAALRRFGPLNGFPFRVGALSILPWIKDWRVHVRLVVHDAAFGNPPGFPFESFVSARRVDIEGSFPLRHLGNLLLRRKEASPLHKVPDFERYIAFDFDHVEVADGMCNFQMFEGKFNINEFTRILADGEVRRALGRARPPPNQLTVRVVRARNLAPGGKQLQRATCDPYVVVRCRRQSHKTHTQNRTVNPMWNETLTIHLDDASTVIEVCVFDREEGSQAGYIGHWAMTAKYLVTDPGFNWHYTEEFEPFRVGNRAHREDGTAGATGFVGWVPLATKKWKRMGGCGQLQLEMLWRHVPEEAIENRYVPLRRYTALEQLSQQSNEDQLRFGDWARVRDWLNHEPFCYDIRRFTVRDTKFYVQDLFRGHKGVPESLVLSQSSVDGADSVRLPFLEMRKQFRPRHGDEGITSYDAFVGFFVGLITSAARSGRLGGAIAQILSGGVWNFGYKFRNLLRGELDQALVPIRARQLRGVANLAKSGFQVLHQNVTQSRRNRAQFKVAVEADDTDFLAEQVELSGHLDRCAVKTVGEVSNAEMAAMARRKGAFKTKYFELKGDTLFYRKHRRVPKGVTYNLTYKVSLDTVYSAVFVRSADELLLNVQGEAHVIRLREPANAAAAAAAAAAAGEDGEDADALQVVRLKNWVKAVRAHDIPFEEFE